MLIKIIGEKLMSIRASMVQNNSKNSTTAMVQNFYYILASFGLKFLILIQN